MEIETMGIVKKEERKQILMKNNELIKTRYDFTVIENRIFMYMLYKLQKDPNGEMVCHMTRSELKQLIKRTNQQTVKGICESFDKLMSKRIGFKIIVGDNEGYDWNKCVLITRYAYNDVTDTFRLYCSEIVYDFLTCYYNIDDEKNKKFYGHTPINLLVYFSLENTMAQRMYELLRLWSNSKEVITYTVDEIKELFMIEDKYSNYSDFKKYIINPSVKSLNKSGAFDITIKENKTGRKVTSISFNVKDLDDRIYFKKDNSEENKNNTSEKPQNQSEEFFIPDKSLFTTGAIILFKKDFKTFDFKEQYLQDAFYDSIAAAFDVDNTDKIKRTNYNYFKQSLLEKIETHMNKDIKNKFGDKKLIG